MGRLKRFGRKRKPRVVKEYKKQTGSRKSLTKDRERKALPPSKRISKSGKEYTETRRNRSDKTGSRI